MATFTKNMQYAYQIDKLSSTNYLIWNLKMQILLIRFEFWTVVDRSEFDPSSVDAALQTTWKLKNYETCFDLIFRCGDWQIQSARTLQISKEVWDKLKATYEQSNMVAQITIHKRFLSFSLSKSQLVHEFLKMRKHFKWHNHCWVLLLLSHKLYVLLLTLPLPWRPFITTQKTRPNQTLSNLIIKMLQEASMC
jgi:hypothetical protein